MSTKKSLFDKRKLRNRLSIKKILGINLDFQFLDPINTFTVR